MTTCNELAYNNNVMKEQFFAKLSGSEKTSTLVGTEFIVRSCEAAQFKIPFTVDT